MRLFWAKIAEKRFAKVLQIFALNFFAKNFSAKFFEQLKFCSFFFSAALRPLKLKPARSHCAKLFAHAYCCCWPGFKSWCCVLSCGGCQSSRLPHAVGQHAGLIHYQIT